MFVIVIAVMSIAMGVAVQTASFQMQREKEAELIFRGQQFIEAIRLYKTKYGRYPMQLKEIYEAKPRVIRKKWKDPITDSESWGLIFLGQDGQQAGRRGRQLAGAGPGDTLGGRGASPIETQTPFGNQDVNPETGLPESSLDKPGAERKMGPIIGVHSTSCDEAIKIWEGRSTYCEWKFVYREERQQGQRGGAGGNRNRQRGYHADEIFKPRQGAGGGTEPGSGTGTGPGGGVNPPPPIRTPRP